MSPWLVQRVAYGGLSTPGYKSPLGCTVTCGWTLLHTGKPFIQQGWTWQEIQCSKGELKFCLESTASFRFRFRFRESEKLGLTVGWNTVELIRSPLTNWPGSHHSHHGNMGNVASTKPPRPKPEKGGNAPGREREGGLNFYSSIVHLFWTFIHISLDSLKTLSESKSSYRKS